MPCTEFAGLLDPYLDGALCEETRSAVDRHLLRCALCAFEVRSLEQTRALLREACGPAEARPGYRERLVARLHDAFEDVLEPGPVPSGGQWALPFPHDRR